MTRTKAWRLSLAAILGFGWLFLTPAYSDDPLGIAQQEIYNLEADVQKLNDKASTQALIDIANIKYDSAVAAKSDMDAKKAIMDIKQDEYDDSVEAVSAALIEKNTAQSAVDGQTVTVSNANTNKNNKYDTYYAAQLALNAHIATYGTGGAQGVSFQIYPLSRDGNYAYLSPYAGLMCQGAIATFDAYAGWGAICGLSENIIGIFKSTVTFPSEITTVRFAGATDDGFRLYVDGVLATERWVEQGTTWSPYTQWYDVSVDKTLELEAWWYNGGGPGNMTVAYMTPQLLTGIPYEWLTWGTPLSQQRIDERQALQTDRNTKYAQYQTALSEYNSANNILTQYQSTLTTKTNVYNSAVTSKNNAESSLTTATNNYNNSIDAYDDSITELQDSIIDAREEYNEQWIFEEQQRIAAAIAQAAANQPQPTPEPTVEPTPEPSPEQTEPVDPTPTPEPDTTNEPTPDPTPEPEPTPEPSPEPSPQPSDIDPEPTPEPEPTPAEPSEEPSRPNTITEDTANLIADLTSKDTLTKLSPEQKAAVAQGLGIKTEELAVVAALAASEPTVAKALEEFGDRIKENASAPMPYTLADATTEVATEAFLSDPIGAIADIDFEKLLSPSEWGKDMTDDQREKAQEVIVPVVIAANIVAAAMTRRI